MHTPVTPFLIFKDAIIAKSGLHHSQIDHEVISKDYDMIRSNGRQADEMAIKLGADMQVMLHEARTQKPCKLPNARAIAVKWTVVA